MKVASEAGMSSKLGISYLGCLFTLQNQESAHNTMEML